MDPQNPFDMGVKSGSLPSLFGSPTREEQGARSEGRIMQRLSEEHGKTKNPEQAILNFLKTPEGAAHIANSVLAKQDPTEVLGKWRAMVTPPNPQQVAPGSALYQTGMGANGQPETSLVASNPTTEVQGFDHFSKIATGNNPDLAALASAKLLGDKGAEMAAVKRMIDQKVISPTEGNMLLGGAWKPIQTVDPDTQQVTGHYWMNLLTGQIAGMVNGQKVVTQPGPSPQQGPNSPSPGTPGNPVPGNPNLPPNPAVTPPSPSVKPVVQATPEVNSVLNDPLASMTLGFGPMALASSTVGTLIRGLAPSFDDPQSDWAIARRQAEQNAKRAMTSHPDAQGRLSKPISEALALFPSEAWVTDPLKATLQMKQVRQIIDQNWAADRDQAYSQQGTGGGAANIGKPARDQAVKSMTAWAQISRTVPTMDQLNLVEKLIREGHQSVPSLPNTAAGIAKGAPGAVVGVAKDTANALGVTGGGAKPAATGDVKAQLARVTTLAPAQLKQLADPARYPNLDPQVREAVQKRLQELGVK